MSVDDAFRKLNEMKDEIGRAISDVKSEQDVRLKLINRILVEVLDWPYDQIRTEPHVGTGYVDYLLFDGKGRSLCVVEAKRIGALSLGTASQRRTTVNVGGQVLKEVSEGITQAIRYGSDTGSPYAVVTDGARGVFFRAVRTDGLPPRDGKAIVFPSFEAVLEDFHYFYEMLAQSALLEQLHLARISSAEGGLTRPVEPRYFVRPPTDARLQPRSDLSRDITEVFNRFFAAMESEQDHEMRTACFVETHESREADISLSKIATHLTNVISSLETEQGKALTEEIQAVIASQNSEICLIVGNKGAGKSTFLLRFFQDVLSSKLKASCVVAHVDVSAYPGDDKSIQAWLAERLRDVFEAAIFADHTPEFEDYMGMFFSTYKRWSEATYRPLYVSDKTAFKIKFGEYVEQRREERPHEYVVGLLNHTVRGRQRLPCVIFDNTDQFPPAVQDAVFQYAVALRNEALCFILIPATDRSVWRLSKSGPLQSYFSRSFYLPTPPAKDVLSKRVTYIRMKLEEDQRVSGSYFSSRGIRISIKDLSAFASIIEESFVNNDGLSSLLGRLSNYDIRRMLLLAQRTITSPTFRVDDLVKSFVTPRGAAPVDYRRAIRAMIVGDYDRHTAEANDFIMNLFWTEGSAPFSPLLACSILQLLLERKVSAGTDIDLACMTVSELVNLFEPCAVGRDETRHCIGKLFSFRLIEPFDPSDDVVSDGTKVGLTPSGHTHLDFALGDEVYVEQMSFVTGYRYLNIRDAVERYSRDMSVVGNRVAVKMLFVRYLLSDDALKFVVPNVHGYSSLTKLRNELAIRWKTQQAQDGSQQVR